MSIDVVYLAYFNAEANYTIEVVENFIASYRKHPAGLEHSLVIIAKNCNDKYVHRKLCQLAEKNNAKVIDLPDDGWDFGAYFRVSKLLNSDYVLFLGSSVDIRSDMWLSKLFKPFIIDSSVQLVGPMGSWGDSKRTVFPNFHIRTCAFMLKRELFLEYATTQKFPVTKDDTYELEHGENSITKFILNKGHNAVVVNNDGEIFEPQNWAFARTFRYPGESKAIIVDKHCLFYYSLDAKHREFLERAAWGRSLKETKIKIFVSYHKESQLFESEVFQPIINNANNFKHEVWALRDNINVNISDKNCHYGELTGHYWVWKNLLPKLTTEYIGFCHYKRFLDFNLSPIQTPFEEIFLLEFKDMFENYTEENILNCINGYDIVLPQKFLSPISIYDLYLESSPKEDMDIALDIIKEIYPEYVDSAEKIINGNELYACLNFVMKKDLVNEYMDWIFNILTTLEQRTDWSKSTETSNIPVNIAEVFFNIWLQHNIETKNLKVLETTSVLVDLDVEGQLAKLRAIMEQVK